MSFIIQEDNVVLNIKLTDYGRKKLSIGQLTFNKFAIGDSEIDYNNITDSYILKPFEKSEYIKTPIKKTTRSNSFVNDVFDVYFLEKTVINTAEERGFFNRTNNTLQTSLYKTSGSCTIIDNNTLSLSDPNLLIELDDLILVRFKTTGNTSNLLQFNPSEPITQSYFKITGVTGTTTKTVSLDRNIAYQVAPYSSSTHTYFCFPSQTDYTSFYNIGDSTVYWDNASMVLTATTQPTIDVKIWQLGIVYKDNMEGYIDNNLIDKTTFSSNVLKGFKNYIGELQSRSLGIIHYTNGTISNFYAEGFYDNTSVVYIPNICYHKKSTMGITLTASTEQFVYQESEIIFKYRNLIETSSNNVIGKVFNDLKLFIIEDEEILSALSWKSNRNYTLPDIKWNVLNTLSTQNSLLTTTAQTIYFTYRLNSSIQTNTLHYQKIHSVKASDVINGCNSNLSTALEFYFEDINDFSFLTQFDSLGLGYHADQISILMQITEGEPKTDAWKEIPISGYVVGDKLSPTLLTTNKILVDLNNYNTGTTYDITDYIQLSTKSASNKLNFGDEYLFIGNITTDIEAKVFQSNIICELSNGEFIKSTNPTWSNQYDYVYISEIGVYDNSDKMVAICKLSKPLIKQNNQKLLLQLQLDF